MNNKEKHYVDVNGKIVERGFLSTRYIGIDKSKLKKNPPQLYTKKNECCGCSACASICPLGAISMEEDERGFLYPVINAEICISCYECTKVCGFKQLT